MRFLLLLIPAIVFSFLPAPQDVQGCAPAPHRGEYVDVNSEEAIILYDSAAKTEHFIRRANFRTEAKDFGFLVPTPTKPELGETKAEIFSTLNTATLPRRVPSGKVHRIVQKRTRGGDGASAPKSAAMPEGPRILDERKNLAGYDVVVLQADDLDGLKKWLEERGYDARPALMTWLNWYVENKWIISAFKVATAPNANNERWLKAVRMSFSTEKPFYPYREPEDMRSNSRTGSRSLRVFFLGDARMEGKLGSKANWAGRTVWANTLPDYSLKYVADGLGLPAKDAEAIGSKKWFLTEFEDHSSPRPGTDEVFFRKAEDQATVERPVIYYDQYEYVYEDEPTSTGTDIAAVAEDEEKRPYLIMGVIGAAVLLTAVGVIIALKVAKGGAA